jgi:transcriptional regulator with XRE-family HTH domain
MYADHLGAKIRQAREQLGLTQGDLAERLGTTQAAVSYVEGRQALRRIVLERYATALGVSVAALMGADHSAPTDARQQAIYSAFAVVCRDEDFGFGARGNERLTTETMLDIVRLYERYKAVHLLPHDFV